jgi:hypothetical protein
MNGTIDYCVSSRKTGFKQCNLNVLEELLVYTSNFATVSTHVESFNMKFELIIHNTESPTHTICALELSLLCCVPDNYFKDEEHNNLKQKALIYHAHTSALLAEVDGLVSRNPMWHCWPRQNVSYIIGIKSFALNFDLRDAIRKTWFKDLSYGACVVFLVGHPNSFSGIDVEAQLHVEQALYGDLLVSELGTRDGYEYLVKLIHI